MLLISVQACSMCVQFKYICYRLVYKLGVCQDEGDVQQVMKEFSLQLTLTVLPPPGPLVMVCTNNTCLIVCLNLSRYLK